MSFCCITLSGYCISNVLEESARIARGNIKPLSQLTAGQFDAIVFPGGFGAAKNLYVSFFSLLSTFNKQLGWWLGLAVTHFIRSTKLL